MKLVLPLPPSVNDGKATGRRHVMQAHRLKNEYRRKCWAAAILQVKPPRDPPAKVVVHAKFYVVNKRDPRDNLPSSLKWVLDALKQRQTGSLRWRQNAYDECGYFIDDGEDHIVPGRIEQAIDRKNPRLVLYIEDAQREAA